MVKVLPVLVETLAATVKGIAIIGKFVFDTFAGIFGAGAKVIGWLFGRKSGGKLAKTMDVYVTGGHLDSIRDRVSVTTKQEKLSLKDRLIAT